VKAAIAAALLLAAAPAFAGPDEDAIRAHGHAWVRAFKAGDIEALMRLYTPDAEVALHGQPKLKGIDAIRGYFTPRLKTPPDADFLLKEESLEVHGNLAIFLSRYWFTLRTGGKAVEDAGRSLIVYRKGTDGKWRIRVDIDQASPDVTFPPPPDAR
jgi:uncharacterized protein (TIGR02246 family)